MHHLYTEADGPKGPFFVRSCLSPVVQVSRGKEPKETPVHLTRIKLIMLSPPYPHLFLMHYMTSWRQYPPTGFQYVASQVQKVIQSVQSKNMNAPGKLSFTNFQYFAFKGLLGS